MANVFTFNLPVVTSAGTEGFGKFEFSAFAYLLQFAVAITFERSGCFLENRPGFVVCGKHSIITIFLKFPWDFPANQNQKP